MEKHATVRLIAVAVAAVLFVAGCGSESEVTATTAEPLVCDTQLSEIVELLQSGLPTTDFDPFTATDQMMQESAAVLIGTVDSVTRDVSGEGWTIAKVSDVDVLFPSESEAAVNLISWSSWWADRSTPDPLERAVSIEGLEVVAFLGQHEAAPGGLTPHIQGFSVACTSSAESVTPIVEPLPSDSAGKSIEDLRVFISSLTTAEVGTNAEPLDGPVMRYPVQSETEDGQAAEIFGVLQVEGECLYLAMDEPAQRFPVIWPAGTTWDPDSQLVTLPNGDQVGLTDEVYGGGGYGYIDSVKTLLGRDAAALAERCVDNEYGEIAMVNNYDDAIGRR